MYAADENGTPPRTTAMSAPQVAMGRDVIDRLDLQGDERVLDAGCGTGRVTAARCVERLPRGQRDRRRRLAGDGRRDPARLGERRGLRGRPARPRARRALDAILSTATFHWIADHERALRPPARGAEARRPASSPSAAASGNVANVQEAIDAVDHPALRGLGRARGTSRRPRRPTRRLAARRLQRRLDVAAADWPVQPEDPREYFKTIVLGSHLERLPDDERDAFVDGVLAQLGDPGRSPTTCG